MPYMLNRNYIDGIVLLILSLIQTVTISFYFIKTVTSHSGHLPIRTISVMLIHQIHDNRDIG